MKNLREALEFYVDNGLDEVILEKSQNHFLLKDKVVEKKSVVEEKFVAQKNVVVAKKTPPAKKEFLQNPLSVAGSLTKLAAKKTEKKVAGDDKFISLNEIVAKAKLAAGAAQNLAELQKAVEDFDGCSLKKMATNTVFCDGNADSEIMVIGEAPGNDEDLQGIPFCGDNGKMLDEMFGCIDLDRKKDFYITNVIFWRPPGNRRPTDEELAICRPFVERHIELFNPKLIILVGGTAMTQILGTKDPITGVRGKIIEFDAKFMNKKIDSFVIFHPSYLMRQVLKKKVAWRDMVELKRVLAR